MKVKLTVYYTVIQRLDGRPMMKRLPSLASAIRAASTDLDKGDHPYKIINGPQVLSAQDILSLIGKLSKYKN